MRVEFMPALCCGTGLRHPVAYILYGLRHITEGEIVGQRLHKPYIVQPIAKKVICSVMLFSFRLGLLYWLSTR